MALGSDMGPNFFRACPGECLQEEIVSKKKQQQKLLQTSPAALWEIISYRRNLVNLIQSRADVPSVTASPVPTVE